MRFSLPLKFFLFAALVAVVPLSQVGHNLVQITRDQLKKRSQRGPHRGCGRGAGRVWQLLSGALALPLMVIRSGVDNPDLDMAQKVPLLTLGMEQLEGVVALQLSLEDSDIPMLVSDQGFARSWPWGAKPWATWFWGRWERARGWIIRCCDLR
ncbi:hypothetical protein [Shimia aestuarii]|uniref:hypothetical protein n=1 Tax=Shimia aestuarii TaxID=254406 RepID=UPI000B870A06|nr:hypothetical protein [Shimia aestuarii]